MADSFTPNLNLALQVTGENSGTWGTDLNTNVISLIDSAFGSSFSVGLSNTDVTLTVFETTINVLVLSGVLSANVNVIFPNVGRTIYIANGCSGPFSVTLKTVVAGKATYVIPNASSAYFILRSGDVIPTPNVRNPATAVAGNVPMFSGSSGTLIVDSGTKPAVIASQAQAEAGTDNTVYNTPLRTAQQTTARIASQAQAQAGTDNTALMTSLRTAQAIASQATPLPNANADPNVTSFPIGSIVAVAGLLPRNSACNVYLNPSDNTAFQITPGGPVTDGTWEARGKIGSSTMIVQRIS